MYYLKYNKEKIFLEKNNKIILINYDSYFEFMKQIKLINDNKNENNVELNGSKITNKNTLIIDISSITSCTQLFNNDNRNNR